jgi:hypothetical protein
MFVAHMSAMSGRDRSSAHRFTESRHAGAAIHRTPGNTATTLTVR